jgi:hypothetical protein
MEKQTTVVTLYASAASLMEISKSVNKFWPCSGYTLIPVTDCEWKPRSGSGKEPVGFRVIFKRGRYFFQRVQKMDKESGVPAQ